MKTHLCMFIALFWFSIANSQLPSYQKSNIANKQRLIGINFSPDICYRTLKIGPGSTNREYIKQYRDDNEIPKSGFTTGINLCFNLTHQFGIETGIQFSKKGYANKFIELRFLVPEPDMPERIKYIYHIHFIDIPIKANFMFGHKRTRFITSAGLVTNIFIKETVTSIEVYPDRTEKRTQPSDLGYNRFSVSPLISFGLDYEINSKMHFRFEPTFKYGILKVNNFKTYLYTIGCNMGFYWTSK
ncbi:MAG: PorT family protein [Bacteroidia bacterium]|nr:PorT family protein [Bacteroidia bacterium]